MHVLVQSANAGGGAGSNTWYTDQRFSLPADLAPGASVTLKIGRASCRERGKMVVVAEMVKKGQFWFSQFGDVTVSVSAAAWTVTYSVVNTPTSWAANQTQSYSVSITNRNTQYWSDP